MKASITSISLLPTAWLVSGSLTLVVACTGCSIITAIDRFEDATPQSRDDAAVDGKHDITSSDAPPNDSVHDPTDEQYAAQDAQHDTSSFPDVQPPGDDPPWQRCTDHDEPQGTTVITVFDKADQFFDGDSNNRRNIDANVDFPPPGQWNHIDMIMKLDCPENGRCDHWDRLASIALVQSLDDGRQQLVEIERYITPYRTALCMRTNVSHLAALLHGKQLVRSFIDTWVGPNSTAFGNGWRVTVKFVFYPGIPDPQTIPEQVHVLSPLRSVEIGNPDNSFAKQMGVSSVHIPSWTKRAAVRSIVTGHGQGNKNGCAEFCPMRHQLIVGDTPFSFRVWRNDCQKNPVSNQYGTWKFPRAGWCPGAYSVPWILDVTSAVASSTTLNVSYDTKDDNEQNYINMCRPGQGDEHNYCDDCYYNNTAGNCDYNSGSHSPPVHYISALLLLYR